LSAGRKYNVRGNSPKINTGRKIEERGNKGVGCSGKGGCGVAYENVPYSNVGYRKKKERGERG